MSKPTIKSIADEVYDYGQYLKTDFQPEDIADEEGNVGGDIRLQVRNGSYQIHTGDSSYDQDHRGAWGASWVPAGCTRKQAADIARDLISQADDMSNDDSND